jgi:hypothetical protein
MNAYAIQGYFEYLDQQGRIFYAENFMDLSEVDDFKEDYAWVDDRLESCYLQEQAAYEQDQLEEMPPLEEEEEEDEEDKMDLSETDDFEEKYAWVDAALEARYLQEQDAYEQDQEAEDQEDQLWKQMEIDYISSNNEEEEEEEDEEAAKVFPMIMSDDEEDFTDMPPPLISDDSDDEELAPVRLFPAIDDDDDDDESESALALSLLRLIARPPPLQRSNTCYMHDNVTIYNGNPNGSRFYDEDEDDVY